VFLTVDKDMTIRKNECALVVLTEVCGGNTYLKFREVGLTTAKTMSTKQGNSG
jgi:hypothetical protein